jgi:hypothetical protein
LRVAGPWRLQILLAHLGDFIALNRFASGCDVDLIKLRRVRTEDLGFDFGRELLVAEFFSHFVTDLEAAEAFDLRLRAAAPDRIGSGRRSRWEERGTGIRRGRILGGGSSDWTPDEWETYVGCNIQYYTRHMFRSICLPADAGYQSLVLLPPTVVVEEADILEFDPCGVVVTGALSLPADALPEASCNARLTDQP